jgi:hypothetical protein
VNSTRLLKKVFLLAVLSIGLSHAALAVCPDPSLGETSEDCPFAEIARTEQAGGKFDLKHSDPLLYGQLLQDAQHSGMKSLWGQSSNFDELAKATIVDPPILKSLAELFKTPWISDQISHAGLEHVYGYLFSTLKTDFGYKRARWVRGEMEGGFGLKEGTLSPETPSGSGGTLFQNVTYFFGRIAFRDDPLRLKTLERDSPEVAKQVKGFNYAELKTQRLEEIIASQKVMIHTDFVPFPTRPDHFLLVYSIVSNGVSMLITGFPVDKSFVDNRLNEDDLGEHKPIVTRYNAFLEGISTKSFTGTRRVVSADYINKRKTR